MLAYIVASILLLLGSIAVALQRLYSAVPARELKRLAAQGDGLAKAVYRPLAFGVSLRLLLWIVAGLSFAGGLTLAVREVPAPAAFALLALTLAALMVWLPTLALTNASARLAMWCAPTLTWTLQRLDRPLTLLAGVLNRSRSQGAHSRLYENADLHELLERQQQQADNRIAPSALERTKRALHFGERYAADIAEPRKKFRAVEAHESLGPVLLDELHAARQSTFLVFDGTFENLVGVLTLSDALKAKQGGQVSGAMRPSITYVHESFTLPEVLAALTATGQQLAVVVNAFAEVVGVITLQQLVQELNGDLPEQSLAYDDPVAIAASRQTFAVPTAQEQPSETQLSSESESESEASAVEPSDNEAANFSAASPELETVEASNVFAEPLAAEVSNEALTETSTSEPTASFAQPSEVVE